MAGVRRGRNQFLFSTKVLFFRGLQFPERVSTGKGKLCTCRKRFSLRRRLLIVRS